MVDRTVRSSAPTRALRQRARSAGTRWSVKAAPGRRLGEAPHALTVRLRFDSGKVEQHAFAADPRTVPDPIDGPAWRAQASGFGSAPGKPAYPGLCASFQPARATLNPARSPFVCGAIETTRRAQTGLFFAVRHLSGPESGSTSSFLRGGWCSGAPRTALWGVCDDDVHSVTVTGGPGGPVTARPTRQNGRTLLAVLPPVDTSTSQVDVLMADGRRATFCGDHNLIDSPKGLL